MFDMRYHIASLVSVFLALTIGLLLGSLIVDQGVLTGQQEKLLESIRADVNETIERNKELQGELEQLRGFQKQVFPLAIRDRLSETTVSVITMIDGQEDLANEVVKGLTRAGASVSTVHIDMKNLNFDEPGLVELIQAYSGDSTGTSGVDERLFWSRLAAELAGVETPGLLSGLRDERLISSDASVSSQNFVFMAARGKEVGTRDTLFLEALSQVPDVRLVGVEPSTEKPSRVAAYKLRNVSTIDNVETVPGKISLIYLFEERDQTAHFGIKSTADRLMP